MPHTASPKSHIAVPTSMLCPEKAVGVALYMQQAPEAPMLLYRGPDYPLLQTDIQQLVDRGVKRLYVASQEHQKYQQYLRDNLKSLMDDESVPLQRHVHYLNEVVRDVLSEVFEKQDVSAAVEKSKGLGNHVVALISREDSVVSSLQEVLYHDYHTFTHSANVSFYAAMLAKELGIVDEGELEQIATGALLHDFGKLDIAEALLTKAGRLDEQEYATIKCHPIIGFRKLCGRDDLTFGQLMMGYQHHECLDGSGYPVGVLHGEIHEWAKICSVADVYEALTSNRPYRSALSHAEAFAIMDRKCGVAFDEGILKCWKTIIAGN